MSGSFLWDEGNLIAGNPYIKRLEKAPQLLTTSFFQPATKEEPSLGEHMLGGYYRPLTLFSFALDHAGWGLNSFGYHLTSLLLHLANILLFYLLGKGLFPPPRPDSVYGRIGRGAFLAAFLFAIHPIHAEAVTYIPSRADLLVAFFTLLGVLLLRQGSLVYGLFCYAGALLSKETGILFPLFGLLFLPQTKRIPFLFGAGGLALAFLTLRHSVLGLPGWMTNAAWTYPPGVLSGSLILQYLKFWIFPWPLLFIYPIPPWVQALGLTGNLFLTGVILLGGGYLLKRLWPKPALAGSLLWFLIGMLPVIHLVPMTPSVAVHFLYLPSMGLFLGAGYGIDRLLTTRWRFPALCSFGTLAALLMAGTLSWNSHTKNAQQFYSWVYESHKKNGHSFSLAKENLGYQLYYEGNIRQTLEIVQQSTDISEEDRLKLAFFSSLALCQFDQAEQALNLLQEIGSSTYIIRSRAAIVAEAKGNLSVAIDIYQKLLLEGLPLSSEIDLRSRLGAIFLKKGESEEAMGQFTRVLEWDPNDWLAWHAIALHAIQIGQRRYAYQILRRMIEYNPSDVASLTDLGILHIEDGNLLEARAFAKRSLDLNPSSPRTHHLWGLIYEAEGHTALARKAWGQALFYHPAYRPAKKRLSTISQPSPEVF